MFMVSNDLDDSYPLGTDEQDTDRTHIIALEGEAIVKYPATNPIAEKRATVPKVGSVAVNIVNMRNTVGGTLYATSAQINAMEKWAIESYAQVGIGFVFAESTQNPPANIFEDELLNIQKLNIITTPPVSSERFVGNEFKTLIEVCGTKGNISDIHVFLVSDLRLTTYYNGIFHHDRTENTGVCIYPLVFNSDGDYLDNIANGKVESTSTLAHELLHLLTNARHGDDSSAPNNLINPGTGTVSNDIKLTRRINAIQEVKIHANTHVQ